MNLRMIHIFQSKDKRWHWHAKRSGRIVEVGAGGKRAGYGRKRDCMRAVAAKLRASYRVV